MLDLRCMAADRYHRHCIGISEECACDRLSTPHLTCETSGMVAANTATEAALYWLLGARDKSGPRDLHAVRPKLVAGFTANTACTCSGLL